MTQSPITGNFPTDVEGKILAKAEARKQTILNCPTTVEVNGTKYYVSNSGNDKNNGLSPETAWATLGKVNKHAEDGSFFKQGDGVFFERGGIWRGELKCAGGVTYSAYGEGAKPKLYSSPESGADAAKWKLYYDQDGVKIWQFYHDISECTNIVFNNGVSYASRVLSYWNGKQAVSVSDYKTPFDMVKELKYDMQFYTQADYSKYKIPFSSYEIDTRSRIYLRCDKGNPGDLYHDMEFQSSVQYKAPGYSGIVLCTGDKIVVDNLCVMYGSTMGLNSSNCNHLTFQNCEVGWVGGDSHIIGGNPAGKPYMPFIGAGEGIRFGGIDNKALNNYVHDCFDGGLNIERDGDLPVYENLTASGNLVERCMSGLFFMNNGSDLAFRNIKITDNYFMYSQYGWSSDEHYYSWSKEGHSGGAMNFEGGPNANEGIYVGNNILYLSGSVGALVQWGMGKGNRPIMSGNTYIQTPNGLVHFAVRENKEYYNSSPEELLNIVTNILGDNAAKVYVIVS